MLDGAALLMTSVFARQAGGRWAAGRGGNFIDGAAHYYTTYRCADGRWIAIGAIEPRFYALLLKLCGAGDPQRLTQAPETWANAKEALQQLFAQKSRDEWCALLEGTDACVAPVLEVREAPSHPHNVARGVFSDLDGVVQPAAAPRFSRTPAGATREPPARGEHAGEILTECGFSVEDIRSAVEGGAVILPR